MKNLIMTVFIILSIGCSQIPQKEKSLLELSEGDLWLPSYTTQVKVFDPTHSGRYKYEYMRRTIYYFVDSTGRITSILTQRDK
jgi:hypothetical protein